MPWIDIILTVILLLSVVVGALRGLLREVLSLMSWIVAAWVAYQFSGDAAEFFGRWLADVRFQVVAAALTLFIGTLIVLGLASTLIAKLLSKAGLQGVDRSLGALFGAVRGGFIMTGLVLLLAAIGMDGASWWQESYLVPWFEVPAAMLASVIDQIVLELTNV